MLEQIILPLLLALLMFGLGMSLSTQDFKRVSARKHAVIAALASILLVMPLIALGVGELFALNSTLAMGLVLLAVCPGGMFSNLVTHTARGDLALSMTLTVLTSLLYVVVAPSIISMAALLLSDPSAPISLSFSEVLAKVGAVVLLPVGAGMLLRRKAPRWCNRAEPIVRWVSTIFVVSVFIALAIDQLDVFVVNGPRVVSAVIVLNLLGWAAAGLLARFLQLSVPETIAVGVEHSIRQEGTGIFIAASLLGRPEMTVPLLLNSGVGLLVSSIVVYGIVRLRVQKRQAVAD